MNRDAELEAAKEAFEGWLGMTDDERVAATPALVERALSGDAPELWSCVFESDMRVVAEIIFAREGGSAARAAEFAGRMAQRGSDGQDYALDSALMAVSHVSDPSCCDLSLAGITPKMAAARVAGMWKDAMETAGFPGFGELLAEGMAKRDGDFRRAMEGAVRDAPERVAAGVAVVRIPVRFLRDGSPGEGGERGLFLAGSIAAGLDSFDLCAYMDSGAEVCSESWSLESEGGAVFLRGELTVAGDFDPEAFAADVDGQMSDGWGEGVPGRTVLDGASVISCELGGCSVGMAEAPSAKPRAGMAM